MPPVRAAGPTLGHHAEPSAVTTFRSLPTVETRARANGASARRTTPQARALRLTRTEVNRRRFGNQIAARTITPIARRLDHVTYARIESTSGPRAARSIGTVSETPTARTIGTLIAARATTIA